ncbi:unnamed protein product [Parnassius apollo]|uniref:(apollo) hypothetical protein n=1 Tax=Parnassius apollo TaxID=110799 RepID=A0A8S3X6N9_PARAO|nr:unnamed protein product [Parnassius apollo]
MSDKSKKSASSGSERYTAPKKRPTCTAKSAKETSRVPLINDLEEESAHQHPSAPPLEISGGGTGKQHTESQTGDQHEPEIEPASSFFTSPKLGDATSSPVLSRTESSLLRIRTPIRQAKAAEAQKTLKATSEAEETGESDVDSGETNISLDASTRSIGGSRMLLNKLPRHANEILQRAKADLEKPGNLKKEIRENVVCTHCTR